MKSNTRCFLMVAFLLIALSMSLALNGFLFNQGRQYYLELNETRLSPLGLNYYPTTPGQQRPANPRRQTVVFFGDSRAANWPSPDLERFEFVNRGVGSQTSAQVVQRFDYHVRPLQPQVVIVQVGINDLKTLPLFPERKALIVANCRKNILEIVERAVDLGATVILTTVFPVGQVPIERRLFWSEDVALAVEAVNGYIDSLAGENVVIFDAYSILADDSGMIRPEYSKDLLHLNAAGYEALNGELLSVLRGLDSRKQAKSKYNPVTKQ